MLRSDHFSTSTLRFLGAATVAATLLAGPVLASESCCAKPAVASASCDVKKSDCAPAAKSVTAAATVRKATGAKRAVGVRKAPVAGAPKIAQAAKPAKPATVVAPVVKPTSVSAGMRIAIDPETHLPIKPSAGQRTAPVGTEGATPAADSKSEVTVTVLPNGTRLVTLGESLMQYSVARRDPSGRLRFDCASSADEARKLAAKPAKPAATVAVEK